MPELEEVLSCAVKAKKHARERVLKGTTHVDRVADIKGSPDLDQNAALRDAVTDMREEINYQYEKAKALEDPQLAWFESNIEISSKYTLGNCYEFALQALDYILNNAPHINAELFQIMRGDHYFLVLNRDAGSDRKKPETWGDDAVICDPWLDAAYQAKHYRAEFKEHFNPDKGHMLTFGTNHLNSDSLFEMRTVANLKENFLKQVQALLDLLTAYEEELKKDKNPITSKKFTQIHALIEKYKKINLNQYNEKQDYRTVRSELLDKLDLLKQEVKYNIKFSKVEAVTLGFVNKKASNDTKPHIQLEAEKIKVKLKYG